MLLGLRGTCREASSSPRNGSADQVRPGVGFVTKRSGAVVSPGAELTPTVDGADVRSPCWLGVRLRFGVDDTLLVTPGREARGRRDAIGAVPLGALGP